MTGGLGIALRIVALGALLLALGGCEGLKRQLGMTKQAPDEFRVVSRAPLTLPPDFGLRPPEPGAPRPQEGTATDQARRAVFRAEEPKLATMSRSVRVDGLSLGEQALLRAAGAEAADPGIRQTVDQETAAINADSQGFLETLVFWREKDRPGVVVDAQAEAQRLRENAALGKVATEGQTPTIQRRKKALLEGIF